jgi:hypothetical protein
MPMTAPSPRPVLRDAREPVRHDLESLRIEGRTVAVRLVVRRAEDGMWRARLLFAEGESDAEPSCETVEIFCAVTEQDLWHAVAGMGVHHLRDLYRALAPTA